MITLYFHKSNSKRYKEAVKLSGMFPSQTDEFGIKIMPPVKEIFEKWEFFNKLFWIVVDWNGAYLDIDGMKYLSHKDKTRIFYSLQLSHSKWINYVEMKTFRFFDNGEFKDSLNIDPKEADYIIDLFTIQRDKPDSF